MAYVYGLRTTDSVEYFYIGSTKHPIEFRLKGHLDQIKRGLNKNRHLVNKINQVGSENVIIELIEEVPDIAQFEREYEIIHDYVKRGVNLTNVRMEHQYYEWIRRREEYDEFQLEPHHIFAILEAYEHGCLRTGDKLHDALADFVDKTSRHIIDKHLEEFKQTISEVMNTHHDSEEANRQTAILYQRISEMLERD
jgi:hypothetical protein